MTKVYITPKQATELYSVTKANLAKRRHLQQPPTYYRRGKIVLYKVQEFEKWIQEGQVSPSGF